MHGQLVVLEPVADVAHAAHVTDLDHLLFAELPGGDARIHAVRQPVISAALCLDDGRQFRTAEHYLAERILRLFEDMCDECR